MHISRRDFIKAGAAGLGAMAADGLARNLPGTPTPLPPAHFSRVAFGSCLHDSAGAAVLDTVVKAAPHAFVWLGDNIYGDTADMALLRSKYKVLADNPRFQKLKAHCPNLALWDDHDYGLDNAGLEYAQKKASQQIFLDFWGVSAQDPRRTREGIYHSQIFGETGRTVHIICLDGRYHRTTDKRDPEGTMLGATQWKWLEDQLKVPASLRIICSGIQVVPDEHGYEGWHEFPREKTKLYNLIKDSRTGGVVFTSGDQHWAELSKADKALGYPAYDLTASSLDQEWDLPVNNRRVGAGSRTANFGIIDVEWERPDPLVHFRIHSASTGSILLDHPVGLSTLHPWSTALKESRTAGKPRRFREARPTTPAFGDRGATGRKLPPG